MNSGNVTIGMPLCIESVMPIVFRNRSGDNLGCHKTVVVIQQPGAVTSQITRDQTSIKFKLKVLYESFMGINPQYYPSLNQGLSRPFSCSPRLFSSVEHFRAFWRIRPSADRTKIIDLYFSLYHKAGALKILTKCTGRSFFHFYDLPFADDLTESCLVHQL